MASLPDLILIYNTTVKDPSVRRQELLREIFSFIDPVHTHRFFIDALLPLEPPPTDGEAQQ